MLAFSLSIQARCSYMMQLTSHEEHESALLVVLLGAVGSTCGCWGLPGSSAVLSLSQLKGC